MADRIYTVELNGQKLEIQGPEGATPEQLQRVATQHLLDQQNTNPPSVTGAVTDPQFYGDLARNAGDFGKAFVHHAMNIAHGGAQFVENVGAGLALRAAPNSSIANTLAKTAMQDEAAMAAREANYQKTVPDSTASYAGATLGEIAPFLLGGPLQSGLTKIGEAGTRGGEYLASKVPALGGLLRAGGSAVGRAAQGAAISAAAPVTSGDYLKAKKLQVPLGSAVGVAAPVVPAAIRGTVRGVKGVLAPFTNPESIVQRAVGGLAKTGQNVAGKVSTTPELVPGSIPTTAQAAPTPEMIQAEKTLANNPALKPLFVQRQLDQNAARIAAVQSVAGEPGALEAAKAERSRVAKNLYDWAFSHQEKVTPWMKGQVSQLMKRPAMQSAMKQARVLAQNEGLKLNNTTSVQGLHYAKVALDDQISTALRQGNNNEARILIGTRDKLLTLMDKLSPTYAQARSEFAAASKPVNTMEVANELLDRLNQAHLRLPSC